MKKVVYISWEHLSEKLERDWYISHLLSKGVPVEFWDATNLLFKRQIDTPSVERDYVSQIDTYIQLEGMLRQNAHQDVSYVLIVCYESRFYDLFRLLTRYKCKLYFISWGEFPIQYTKPGRLFRKLFTDTQRLSRQVWNWGLAALLLKIGLIKPIDVVFAAGEAAVESNDPKKAKVIPFNLCDYDNYLIARNEPRLIKERYCVFLDINLGKHSDVKIGGLGNYINPDNYLASLNRFFDLVEKKFGAKVVIAAHPMSDYSVADFSGRTILKGKTPELVKDAEFAISHHSASISYAVLNMIPLLFIYTSEMKKTYQETVVAWIKLIADFLHADPAYNIDSSINYAEVVMKPVNEEAYNSYKYNYLTTRESEGRLNADTFYREVLA